MEHLDDRIWALLRNDRFIKWVLTPDEETNLYWEKWMEERSDGRTILLKAREIVCDLAYTEKPAGAKEMADAIWAGIAAETYSETHIIGHQRPRWIYWAAASVLLLIITGLTLTQFRPRQTAAIAAVTAPQETKKIATVLLQDDLERSNQSTQNQQVYLVDGSKVILQPGASIRYAAFLQNTRREIYLKGNAFFEVAKDAGRPFYVYTHDLVVRVLGTSFKVTNKENGDITVLVHTGKVAVSKKTSPTQQPLVLESNHLALYNEQTHNLVQAADTKTGIEPSAIEVPTATNNIPFNFEETPVTEIFATLQEAYGIPLHYNTQTFSGCRVTTSLADETFEEKLKIICTAIGASYKIGSNGVSLDGKPCK